MKSKIYILIISITFFSCNTKKKEYYSNGVLKNSFTVIKGKIEGKYERYYESGNLNVEYNFYDSKKVDSSIYYRDTKYKNIDKIIYYLNDTLQYKFYNNLQELVLEGKGINDKDRIGKWKYYKKDYDSIVEYKYVNIKNTPITYVNQIWTISKKGDTIPYKSNYFSFYKGGKDTIKTGEILKINLMLVEPKFSYDSDIEVILPLNAKELKDDFSNFYDIKLDTFKSLKNDGISNIGIPKNVPINQIVEFGIQYETLGKKRIRGILVEYFKDTAESRIERRLFFDKTITVTESDVSNQKKKE